MNGPPQKPTTAWSGRSAARTSRTASSTGANASSGSGTRRRSTSAMRADRLVDHRADALDEPDVDPHPEHRGHDVREHHGRVDVVAAHRLQRHLRAQLGRVGDIEECVLLADGAIFRKRPARLAHEPHRRPLDFLAPRGAHEKRLAHLTRVAPIVNRVGEHSVTAGPLAPRWLAWSLEPPRAGTTATARVSLENAGTATWRSHGTEGVQASFHWLDPLGNPIVWDGPRTPLAARRRARASRSSWSSRSPRRGRRAPTGSRSISSRRTGSGSPRSAARRSSSSRGGAADRRRERSRSRSTAAPDPATSAALAAQEEPLARVGACRGGRASRRRRDSAARVVAPRSSTRTPRAGRQSGRRCIADRARPRARALARRGGRNPRFDRPLLLPSLLAGIEPTTHLGLPAYAGDDGLFDGRVAVTLPRRSGRRPT